ncbi:hypothetical protein NBRC116601_32080 [Cognatishimia sp. WU-CL00825]
MDLPVITLTSKRDLSQPIAMMESAEVLPGISLGDVLAEELGLDVPYGALVLVQPQGFSDAKDYSGNRLGELLGNVILQMTKQGQSIQISDVNRRAGDSTALDFTTSFAATGHISHPSASRMQ